MYRFTHVHDSFYFAQFKIRYDSSLQTWLNTASTSLAHLEKVQANVYNFGIADPRDLKATNLRSRKLHPPDTPAGHSDVGTDRTNLQHGSLNAW